MLFYSPGYIFSNERGGDRFSTGFSKKGTKKEKQRYSFIEKEREHMSFFFESYSFLI